MVRWAIDPGHGGSATGCVCGELVESDVTMAAALRLAERLDAAVITRDKADNPWFATRGWRTRDCDAVVSLHVNANVNPSISGLEIYHWPRSAAGMALALRIAERAPLQLRPPGRGCRIYSVDDDPATKADDWLQRPRSVLRWHRPPAVLVELGYASNADDREYLLSDDGLTEVVGTIAEGCLAWVRHRAVL